MKGAGGEPCSRQAARMRDQKRKPSRRRRESNSEIRLLLRKTFWRRTGPMWRFARWRPSLSEWAHPRRLENWSITLACPRISGWCKLRSRARDRLRQEPYRTMGLGPGLWLEKAIDACQHQAK